MKHDEALSKIPFATWVTDRTEDIAKAHGIPFRTVHDYRIQNLLPKQPRRPGGGRPPKWDWSRFDPSLSDSDNAARIGCSQDAAQWFRQKKLRITLKRGRKPKNKTSP